MTNKGRGRRLLGAVLALALLSGCANYSKADMDATAGDIGALIGILLIH